MSIEELKKALNKSKKIKLTVRVKPGAKQTELVGFLADGSLKISVKSAPLSGKANEELLTFLARILELPRDAVLLKSGATQRLKQLVLLADRIKK